MKTQLLKIKFILQSIQSKDTWKNIEPCDVLLLKHDANCGYNYQGKIYSPLVDSFLDYSAKENCRVQTVAKFYSSCIGDGTYGSPYSMNRVAFKDAFFSKVLSFLSGKKYAQNYRNKKLIAIWLEILMQAKPKIVVTVQPEETLCEAGRILNIPVYDLQHGVIEEDHPWYGSKYRVQTEQKKLPAGFLCWDDVSAQVINRWSMEKGITAQVIGHPWFLRFKDKMQGDELVKEATIGSAVFNNNKPTILVTLAWGMKKYSSYSNNNGVLIPSLEQTILTTHDRFNWLIRLHPKQIRGPERKETYQYLERTFMNLSHAVNWNEASSAALPVLLSQTNLHITYFSTVVVEAAWFGIPTGLLSQELLSGGKYDSYYQEQRNSGIAEILPQSNKAIIQWIESKKNIKINGSNESKNQVGQHELNKVSSFIQQAVHNS